MPKAPKVRRLKPERVKSRVIVNQKHQASASFFNSTRWKSLRNLALRRDDGICQECKRNGRMATGNQIDHIKPRSKFPELAYEIENLQTLCARCHNRKRREE